MRSFRLEVGQSTDVGRKRTVNEDNLGLLLPPDPKRYEQAGALFVVADGMGGHAKGEVASALAVDVVLQAYRQAAAGTLEERLATALREANAAIWDEASQQTDQAGMGTTVVCAVVVGSEVLVNNAGDSRAYLIRQKRPRQLTRDHSWVSEMVALGRLSASEARKHRMRNVITRCLGGRPEIDVPTYAREPLLPGDALVLCTDGLWGTTADQEIASYASSFSAQVAAERLVALANERGGPDNVTVIVVRVEAPDAADDDNATLTLRFPDDDKTLPGEGWRGGEHDLQ